MVIARLRHITAEAARTVGMPSKTNLAPRPIAETSEILTLPTVFLQPVEVVRTTYCAIIKLTLLNNLTSGRELT